MQGMALSSMRRGGRCACQTRYMGMEAANVSFIKYMVYMHDSSSATLVTKSVQ